MISKLSKHKSSSEKMRLLHLSGPVLTHKLDHINNLRHRHARTNSLKRKSLNLCTQCLCASKVQTLFNETLTYWLHKWRCSTYYLWYTLAIYAIKHSTGNLSKMRTVPQSVSACMFTNSFAKYEKYLDRNETNL